MSTHGSALRGMDKQRAKADRALFERLADAGDPVDRDALVERFLPLARSIARRYTSSNESFEDIFQVACVGLVKAIDRYDPSRGQAFSSYAVPTISGEIKRYYRDRTWSVHVPRDLQELTLAVDRARNDLETTHGRSPTVAEIAERLRVDEEDVVEALQARHAQRADCLDAPARTDDGSSDTLGDRIATHELGFGQAEKRADLGALARILTPRERFVLRLRFEYDLTQAEIGARVGLSQMQISRILRSAVERLRDHSEDRRRQATRAAA
ncbi:MAG TPA: SigB/SigF/SigG family RNA polymerase sigma factor [Solirubrobacteraceae bacterium]